VMLTSTQLARRVLPRFGVRKILVTGLTISWLGQVWLHTISSNGSYQLNVLGGIMITALGMGLVFPTVSVAVTAGVGMTRTGRNRLPCITTIVETAELTTNMVSIVVEGPALEGFRVGESLTTTSSVGSVRRPAPTPSATGMPAGCG